MYGKYYAKEIFCSAYSPGRRIVEFAVVLKNIPGALAEASSVVAGFNVNVLSGFHIASATDGTALWSFFADVTESSVGPNSIAEKLRRLNVVLDVNLSERNFDGLCIDDLHFPLTVLNDRSIVFRVETIAEMFRKLRDTFGSGAALIIYTMGMGAGRNRAESVGKKYGAVGLRALQIIMAERTARGWGLVEVKKMDEGKLEAVVEVEDLFECLPYRGAMKEPQSVFFRGYLEGVFSVLFNKKVRVREVECVAKGDQKCVFAINDAAQTVKPPEKQS